MRELVLMGVADDGSASNVDPPADTAVAEPSTRAERPHSGHTGSPDRPPGQKDREANLLGRPAVRIAALAVLVVLIVAGLLWWLHERHYESTDDAYVDANLTRVAPQTSGIVSAVYVTDNQLVRTGQLLVQIDPADARARLQQNLAQKAQAETALTQTRAQIEAAQATYRQALANLASAQAQAVNAAANLKRYEALKANTPQAVAQEQLDEAIATARSAEASARAARQQTHTAAAQVNAARAQLAGAEAGLRTSGAQLEQQQISLGYTQLFAPVAGHVAQKSVAVGNYVSPGAQLMAIVPLDLYITANFKETQLALMRARQPVDVHIDACPGADVRGHVASIQSGAGQAFALLPPENATGNFVKVVQRVPVKILLDRVPSDCVLGPGESVEPRVTVR